MAFARTGIGIAIAVAILLVFAAALPYVAEDAYISYRYATNLVDHGQLVFNLGERVEGYTNFSWTLALAGAHGVGLPLAEASRWLGFAFAVGSLVYTYRYARLFDEKRAFIAPLVLGSMVYHAMWTWLGLEATAFGFFVLASLYYVDERGKDASYISACSCATLAYFTRPEGGLAILAIAAIVLLRRTAVRWRVLAWFAFVLGAHLTFRLLYYNAALPNTFHAKAHVSIESITYGARYVGDLLLVGGGALALAIAAACRRHLVGTDTDRVGVALVVAYLGYLVLVGGDYMGASRFGVPMLPLVSVWSFRVAVCLWERGSRLAVIVAIVVHLGLAIFAIHRELATTTDGFISRVGFLERYVHDRLIVGAWLEKYVDGQRTITGSAMGVLPWHLRHAHVIDARGITDRSVAESAPMVSSRPGHARFASEAYLLAKTPEILIHHYGIGPEPKAWPPPPGYHSVCVELPSLDAGRWFCFAARDDVSLPRIGVPPSPRMCAIVDAGGSVTWRDARATTSAP